MHIRKIQLLKHDDKQFSKILIYKPRNKHKNVIISQKSETLKLSGAEIIIIIIYKEKTK